MILKVSCRFRIENIVLSVLSPACYVSDNVWMCFSGQHLQHGKFTLEASCPGYILTEAFQGKRAIGILNQLAVEIASGATTYPG